MVKIRIRRYYLRAVANRTKFSYDKTGKHRPGWIELSGAPKAARFINVKIGMKDQFYYMYLVPGIFIPINCTPAEMAKYYDHLSGMYEKAVIENNSSGIAMTVRDTLKFVKKAKGPVLDIGSGTGLGAEALKKAGYDDITLIDISKGMLAQAKKKKCLDGCTFARCNFLAFKPKKKYSLITSFFSFPMLSYYTAEEIEKGMKKIHSMLKGGGIFAVHSFAEPELFKPYFKVLSYKKHWLKNGRLFSTSIVARKAR